MSFGVPDSNVSSKAARFLIWARGTRGSNTTGFLASRGEKVKKNVLTPKTEIWYHAPLGSETDE
jgi:hypothetical protein